ncbi:metabolite traffic protein EboE [Streptomyces sp. P38-E01]|uniref:Metabolite traffic protein EboE n=1 Tax=Streptomyces tardus TaxID=2780544 RepID=A0A949JKU0_9ACTN|nr:metabolite traffic protein EboE [Streptomyces tardus]MBU7600629.1 metabolite traffic protein EboE [Streptomyces tardus]
MRFRHPDGSTVHLAYCTNVHPAETLDGVIAQLRDHAEPVRRRLGRDRLGIGLWLAHPAAEALVADRRRLDRLRGELDRRGLEVVTLNGFPYQGFGDERVKYRVYRPDWTEPERLRHTVRLAELLAELLPEDVTEGTISTLPLAWRTDFDAERLAVAHEQLHVLARELDALEARTGRRIRIGLEPEPGCTVETTAQAVAALRAPGAPPVDRIGMCLDTCHLATAFEDPGTAVALLDEARVPVHKVQLSAALHSARPHDPQERAALERFVEPRFLHQTRVAAPGGVRGADDLDLALAGEHALATDGPWRVHLHVPLHAELEPPLTSTLQVLRETLGHLLGGPRARTHHLEVETYTWQALPEGLRPTDADELADGIAAELVVARDLLTDLGLKEQS